MIDTTAIKRYYLRNWVDRSQAARKAAEELAMKDSTTLSDRYKEEGLVFTLDRHKVEFKGENEINPKDLEYNFFTYEEAMERFGKPNKEGWRLPTNKELEALCNYPYKFKDKQEVLDNRLSLPAAGFRGRDGYVYDVGSDGIYWSSTSKGLEDAWYLSFYSGNVGVYSSLRCNGFSVRLVRDL